MTNPPEFPPPPAQGPPQSQPWQQPQPGSTAYGESVPAYPAGSSSKGKWIAGAAAGVLVASVLGGVGYAAMRQGLLGDGGAGPEERVPGNAAIYAELDLDPDNSQKLGAYRFLQKFPNVKDAFSDAEGDPRRQLWKLATDENGDLTKVDFERDVAPWLGNRGALAMVPGVAAAEEPTAVGVIQVKDEDEARSGIARLMAADEGEDAGYVVSDGYVTFAETQAEADAFAAAARTNPLSKHQPFVDDMDRIGETGVTSGWVDLSRIRDAIPADGMSRIGASQTALADTLEGRLSWAVRFDGDDLEMTAKAVGMADTPAPAEGANELDKLPATTGAAFSMRNADDAIRQNWPKMVASAEAASAGFGTQLDQLTAQYGLNLPEDLAVLFGDSTTVALDARGAGTTPRVGARIVTDADRFEQVVNGVLQRTMGVDLAAAGVTLNRFDGGLTLATDPAYAAELAGDGTLGETAQFQAALPDVENADAAAFVDVDTLAAAMRSPIESAESRAAAEAIDSIGLTASYTEAGSAELKLRIITK